MNITAVVRKDNSLYQFTTEVNEEQMRFLLEHAIRDLITKGVIPTIVKDAEAAGIDLAEAQKAH